MPYRSAHQGLKPPADGAEFWKYIANHGTPYLDPSPVPQAYLPPYLTTAPPFVAHTPPQITIP